MIQLLGTPSHRPPVGASPLDPTGGLPSPRPPNLPPPPISPSRSAPDFGGDTDHNVNTEFLGDEFFPWSGTESRNFDGIFISVGRCRSNKICGISCVAWVCGLRVLDAWVHAHVAKFWISDIQLYDYRRCVLTYCCVYACTTVCT